MPNYYYYEDADVAVAMDYVRDAYQEYNAHIGECEYSDFDNY